jgi:dihydroorotate dehydrogenase
MWRHFRGLLFRFDAELIHRLTLLFIRLSIRLWNVPLYIVSGGVGKQALPTGEDLTQVSGLTFASRVGLAAGFDKNGDILLALPSLGFGFAEIGTVTPRPQAGNPQPRLFRDSSNAALFNQMGFNNIGATLIAKQLARARERLPQNFRVGVNLGKNKDTPIELAAQDYMRAVIPFEGLADYLVVNVSSPNTPGLRSLQSVDALKPILLGLREKISGWKKVPPVFLKLAPELEGLELTHLIQAVEGWEYGLNHVVDGWVLTNTLEGVWPDQGRGGWSGQPLAEAARRSLVSARRATKRPIVSVGGIMSADEALARISVGAELVQIYTGWIYNGPSFPRELSKRISQSLKTQKP